jgi:hypothetical protein
MQITGCTPCAHVLRTAPPDQDSTSFGPQLIGHLLGWPTREKLASLLMGVIVVFV